VDRRRYVFGVDDLALALGISALTGGAAAGAGMLANKNRKGGGYEIIYPKQPSYSEPRMRLTSDYITQNLQRIMEGKFPAWYEGIAPLLKKQQQQGLNEAYYGDQFQPGILNQTQAYDVARGLGRGAAASKTYATQLQKYAQQEKVIDDYISQLGYQAQESGAYQFPQLSMQLSQDERAWGTPVGMYQQSYEQNAWDSIASMFGSMGSAVPWLMTNMPSATTATSGVNVNQAKDLARSFINPADYTWNSPLSLSMTSPFQNWGTSALSSYGTGSYGSVSPKAQAMLNMTTPSYSQSPAQFAGDWISGMGQTITAPWRWANQGASQLANWWYGNK
jgi:hypothetical protein